jgi:poly(3-hydroxybutyrate) depolymerase
MPPTRVLRILQLGATVIVTAFGLSGARADLIILKDGFVLRGKVQVQGTTIMEKTEDGPVLEFIRSGFYYIDDGARRVIFVPQLVSHVEQRKIEAANDVKWDPHMIYSAQARPTPPILEITDVTAWDKKWDRKLTYRGLRKEGTEVVPVTLEVPQHLTMMTPEYAFADSLKIGVKWRAHYLTRELGPEVVRELLGRHKDFKDDEKLDEEQRISRRFKIYHFLADAEWLAEAEEELNKIDKEFSAAKDRVAEARKNLAALKALQLYDDIKRTHDAGQYQWVKEHFKQLPDSGLPEKMHAEMRALRAEYEAADANLKLARRYFTDLAPALSIGDAGLKSTLTEAAKTIAGELHLEHFLKSKAELRGGDKDGQRVGRLDTFLSQMAQYERDKKQNRKLDVQPENLLALGISGWLLGGRSAEAKPEFAQQLWLARKLVFQHQKTVRRDAREKLVTAYKELQTQRNPAISVEEFAQMIPYLPPIEPPAAIKSAAAARNIAESAQDGTPLKFIAESARGGGEIKYHVQLPPEYHTGRPWPVLVVLHQANETAKNALARWSGQGSRNGYVVAAPEWSSVPGHAYEYSAEEHNAVLDLLRDLRRKFQVDSDRVFLTGSASGGNMAFDVGMSHPDEFAGILPISGLQGNWGDRYRRNAQYLPYYVVAGDMAGGIHLENRRLFKDWIANSYPMIYVEYKGRGAETFESEATLAFDWMNRKTRANPTGEAGAPGREFRTMRNEDNHFYWLSTDSIAKNCIMPAKWKATVPEALLSAQVIAGNKIDVKASGLKQVTVWFGRGLKVNINAPVTITVNNALKWAKPVKPDLLTLLEDFYERGDRQRLYVARVDIGI